LSSPYFFFSSLLSSNILRAWELVSRPFLTFSEIDINYFPFQLFAGGLVQSVLAESGMFAAIASQALGFSPEVIGSQVPPGRLPEAFEAFYSYRI
jgi:hypothetical protein